MWMKSEALWPCSLGLPWVTLMSAVPAVSCTCITSFCFVKGRLTVADLSSSLRFSNRMHFHRRVSEQCRFYWGRSGAVGRVHFAYPTTWTSLLNTLVCNVALFVCQNWRFISLTLPHTLPSFLSSFLLFLNTSFSLYLWSPHTFIMQENYVFAQLLK